MRHIDEFTIDRFRGIRDLRLEGLGQVNLLVGNNNSGKTTVLEALYLFCNPLNRGQWLDIATLREIGPSQLSLTSNEELIWLFPRKEDHGEEVSSSTNPEVALSALGSFSIAKVSAQYEEFSEIVPLQRYPVSEGSGSINGFENREVEGIKVDVSSSIRQGQQDLSNGEVLKETLEFSNRHHIILKKRRQKMAVLPVQIISQSSHRLSSTPSQLWSDVINAETKSDAIKLLRFFDSGIEDVDIVIAEDRPTVSVKHEKLGRAPLSTFGDGLRRVFTLAAAISGVRGGLLLVDELEMAIHTGALEKTFDWLVKACIQNNVQLFATTHSLEAVDAIIAACGGESIDLVAYRLEKGEDQTTVKRFNKKLLTRLRENLGMEVR